MPRRIALIVGVSQYDKSRTGLDSLAAPVNDAQRVYEVLAEYGGFDELYPLPLAKGEVDRSGWVTAQELRAKLHEVLNPQLADEVEVAVFYFSGHGVNPDGQVAYLSASDKPLAVAISYIAKLAKHSAVKNICIWLDCCHSGEMLEFSDLTDKGFCVVAASHADGEALAADGNSLLTNLLCEALTPLNGNPPEIRVMDFIQTIAAKGKNLPQQVVCLARGNTAFTLTQFHGETTVTSAYPPDYPPYKGLLTFTKDDSPFFFGRDGMIQQLLDKLSASRFVPLLGASGSGKSSLVLAGLLPKLPESDWQVLVMRPTANSLQNLRDTLVRGFPDVQVGTVATGADLQREVSTLVTAGKRLLLVIDQFEEVFTECRDDAVRAAFFACLLEALEDDNPLHLVLTLRADFLGHCTEQAYSGLGQCLQHHALLLVAPAAAELREAIARPLALVGMKREQALEDELVDQTLHAKGSLPLLQYVLEKLWQSARQEGSRELTLAMYQQLGGQHGGGLRGVLNEKADAFYQQLEPQQQRLMEWLMVELTQVGDGQDDTRRTVTLQELHHRQPQYTEALDALLEQLVTHERLLTQDHDDHGQATITVAHEALIRDWQRLRGWLESNREIKSWRIRIEYDVVGWQKNGGSLLHDGRLAEAQEMLARYPDSLLIGEQEMRLIQISQEHQKRELQEKERIFTEILVGKLTSQARLAMLSPSVANGYITRALLLAVQAFRLDNQSIAAQAVLRDGLQMAGSLRRVWHGHRNIVSTLSFISEDKIVVGVGNDNAIHRWHIDTGQYTHDLVCKHESEVTAVAFSPDGKIIVSVDKDGLMLMRDMASGITTGTLWCGHDAEITVVAFDGKYVVSGSKNHTLRLWDITNGRVLGEPWYGHQSFICTVAFSPDGLYVVSGGEQGEVRLWSAVKGQMLSELWHGQETVAAVAFSPDGQYVISASADSTIRLWDVESGQAIGEPWLGHDEWVSTVAFSPDGLRVASGSADKTVRLWDIASGQPIAEPWRGHESEITALVFSSDGKCVFSMGADCTLRLWDTENGQVLGKPWREHEEWDFAYMVFSPDGRHVVGLSLDKTVCLWDTESGQVFELLFGHKDWISALAFSPDGKYLVSGNMRGILQLWDVATGQSIGDPWRRRKKKLDFLAFSPDGKHEIIGEGCKAVVLDVVMWQSLFELCDWDEEMISALAFSPDGKHVVSQGDDGNLWLWDVTNGQALSEPWYGHEKVSALAFSPDGKYLVSGSKDKTVRLWDAATGEPIGEPWRGHENWIAALAFSPDGKRVVSADQDNTIRLWDVSTGQSMGEPWHGHEQNILALTFSPNGHHVLSASQGCTLHIWDADPESWAKKACSIVNRNFSLAEWQRFIGDALPYQKTCPDLPAPCEDGWVEPYVGG